jgi:hypothetical protein
LRVVIHKNEYLYLYEVEPEDKVLNERFGVKFITQRRNASLDLKCNLPIQEHLLYEQAVVKGLRQYLISLKV